MPKKPKLNEVACPKCKEPMAVTAEICPHCRTVFDSSDVARRVKSNRNMQSFGCLAVIGIVTAIVVFGGDNAPEKPEPTAKADTIAMIQKVRSEAAACDQSFGGLEAKLKANDLVGAYAEAENAENTCLETNFTDVEVPSSVGKAHYKDLQSALNTCKSAYASKWSGAKALKAMIDGDQKVSTQSEVQTASRDARNFGLACSLGMIEVATKLGATEKDLGTASKP